MNDARQRYKLPMRLLIGAVILIPIGLALQRCWWEIDPPERGIIADRDFPVRFDEECVSRTLQKEFGDDIMHFGGRGGDVPEGKEETVFIYYSSPDQAGWAALSFIDLGKTTRVSHHFLGHGPKLPQAAFPPALKAMKKATDALKVACHLDISGMKMREIGQRVDAIH